MSLSYGAGRSRYRSSTRRTRAPYTNGGKESFGPGDSGSVFLPAVLPVPVTRNACWRIELYVLLMVMTSLVDGCRRGVCARETRFPHRGQPYQTGLLDWFQSVYSPADRHPSERDYHQPVNGWWCSLVEAAGRYIRFFRSGPDYAFIRKIHPGCGACYPPSVANPSTRSSILVEQRAYESLQGRPGVGPLPTPRRCHTTGRWLQGSPM